MCWDISSQALYRRTNYADIETLKELKKRFEWQLDTDSILNKDFDAVVITDNDQFIKWTSRGFKVMTGYSTSYALNKKPSFLQGINSEVGIKKEISDAILKQQPIKTVILNYRKDGSEYRCQIEIEPLFTIQNKLTHFIAFEKSLD